MLFPCSLTPGQVWMAIKLLLDTSVLNSEENAAAVQWKCFVEGKVCPAPETSWLSFMLPNMKPLHLGPKGMGKRMAKRRGYRNCLYLPSCSSGEQLIFGFPNRHYSSERRERKVVKPSFSLSVKLLQFPFSLMPKECGNINPESSVTYLPLFPKHFFILLFTAWGLLIHPSIWIIMSLWHTSLKIVKPCCFDK